MYLIRRFGCDRDTPIITPLSTGLLRWWLPLLYFILCRHESRAHKLSIDECLTKSPADTHTQKANQQKKWCRVPRVYTLRYKALCGSSLGKKKKKNQTLKNSTVNGEKRAQIAILYVYRANDDSTVHTFFPLTEPNQHIYLVKSYEKQNWLWNPTKMYRAFLLRSQAGAQDRHRPTSTTTTAAVVIYFCFQSRSNTAVLVWDGFSCFWTIVKLPHQFISVQPTAEVGTTAQSTLTKVSLRQ